MTDTPATDRHPWAVFLIFLRLGLTAFGGPVAHLGYFREEFVTRRRWLSERSYADLVALCQFLPGPASSQGGLALGLSRAGYAGALSLEAVHQDYMNTLFDDVLTEVVALRDAFYHWRGVD